MNKNYKHKILLGSLYQCWVVEPMFFVSMLFIPLLYFPFKECEQESEIKEGRKLSKFFTLLLGLFFLLFLKLVPVNHLVYL